MRKTLLLFALIAAILAGCSPRPVYQAQAKLDDLMRMLFELAAPSGPSLFAAGLQHYEEGHYADAAAKLHAALEQGLSAPQQVEAHKHLAFIYCTADLEPACRTEFRKALLVDPKLELDAAEAGHPAGGPVFKRVRADR